MDYANLLRKFQEEQAYTRSRFAQLEAEHDQLKDRVTFLEARLDSVYADTLRELEGKLESMWRTLQPLLCSGLSARQVEQMWATLFDSLNNS